MTNHDLTTIYKLLIKAYGPQKWWPGESRFEIIIGAILTQNTNWSNVEKAIENLKAAGVLDFDAMYKLDNERLAALIRPAGYYNIKAKRIRAFLDWFMKNYKGRLDKLDEISTDCLREQLLSVSGIGRETADSILLYALNRKIFVVDAYTYRIFYRHKLIEETIEYDELRYQIERSFDGDIKMYNEFHALLVRTGKHHCKPKAQCKGCPLESLPHDTDNRESEVIN